MKMLVMGILSLVIMTGCMTSTPSKDTAAFYEGGVDEIPAGPGLFSGEDGEFVLYSSDKTEKTESSESDEVKKTESSAEDREETCGCESK